MTDPAVDKVGRRQYVSLAEVEHVPRWAEPLVTEGNIKPIVDTSFIFKASPKADQPKANKGKTRAKPAVSQRLEQYMRQGPYKLNRVTPSLLGHIHEYFGRLDDGKAYESFLFEEIGTEAAVEHEHLLEVAKIYGRRFFILDPCYLKRLHDLIRQKVTWVQSGLPELLGDEESESWDAYDGMITRDSVRWVDLQIECYKFTLKLFPGIAFDTRERIRKICYMPERVLDEFFPRPSKTMEERFERWVQSWDENTEAYLST